MGAQLWHHVSGPYDSPINGLREVQNQVLATYDISKLIQDHLNSARDAVAATELDDEYGLLEFYQDVLAKMEKIAAASIPDDIQKQIELVRQIYNSSGEEIGNILDITDVSHSGDIYTTRPYKNLELINLVGTDKPTLLESNQMIDSINEVLNRGESVCYQIYTDNRSSSIGWCFVGNTSD